MAYEEYDYYNEPSTGSLKESLYEILHGLKDPKKLREAGISLKEALQLTPNVTESLGRGGVAQAIGTSGDLRELSNTINSYLPKGVRNFTRAAEFLANPYATAIQQTAPTTEQTLDFVPRATAPYEGYKQHETIGEYIAPSLGYFGGKVLKAGKDLPGGLSIMGPESKLWNKEMAFNAAKLESKGATPDEILEKTGMVRGLDNQWRSEISDLPARMKEGENFSEIHRRGSLNGVWAKDKTTVKDVLEHPQLFEAYPHLGEIEVKPHGVDIPARGSYNQNKNLITLRQDLTPDEAKSVILHELTHGIQGTEEFNRGASAAQLTKQFENKKQYLMSQIENLNTVRNAAFRDNDMEKYAKFTAKRDELAKEYTAIDAEAQGYEDYFKHGGEAEARMVQRRMDLTPEELRKTYPYQYTGEAGKGLDINPDEAIITTKAPGTINMPEQSIEPPKSKQDELGFHSALETAVMGIKQPKGTGEQFLKQLEKTPGVKTEELEVTGLKKYLQDHKFVTKEEVEKYISQQRLQLENKILKEGVGEGNYEDYELRGGEVYDDDEYIRSLADDFHYDLKNDPDLFQAEKDALLERYPELYEGHDTNPYMDARLNQDVEDALWDQAKQQAHDMYYKNPIRHYYDEHGYDVYGNDEMGYSVKDPQNNFVTHIGDHYDFSDIQHALREHLLDEGVLNIDNVGAAKHEDWTLPGKYENYREVLTTLPNQRPAFVEKDIGRLNDLSNKTRTLAEDAEYKQLATRYDESLRGERTSEYQSSHFDEPNILAHTRLNDRIINGKKTLMVEEIQSDWHQAGRKEGYQGGGLTAAEKAEYDALQKEADNLMQRKDLIIKNLPPEKMNRMRELSDKKAMERNGVPDAPFKKNWHELMMKQILNEAVKGDYEAVAFTTGRQQVERYENSLRKAVDKIEFSKTFPNTTIITATKDGRNAFEGTVKDGKFIDGPGEGKTIEEVLGKGIANQVEEHKTLTPGVIEGKDLTIGGEGMKGFYDKILPDFVNKYTKKYGMAVKKENLGLDDWRHDLSDEELAKGLEHFGTDTKKFYQMGITARSDLYKKISKELYPIKSKDDVHFVELTDAAKKDIKSKGQPMFSGIGLAAPALMPEDQDKTKK
jgi:hypothetical protein